MLYDPVRNASAARRLAISPLRLLRGEERPSLDPAGPGQCLYQSSDDLKGAGVSEASERVGVGIIGCGNISTIYLKNAQRFTILNPVACADLDMTRAEARAAEFGIKACTVEQLLADPSIEIVINLTIPAAHASVALRALDAGKHVYTEKPLSISRSDARQVLELARERRLLVGCAPDTFLGAGLQTCLKLIEDGWIGTPVGGFACFASHGAETWHPDPEFLYKRGAGPLLDVGPYYVTALVTMLGPVKRVTGSARTTFPTRTITSKPKYGQVITVDVPTHYAGVLDFAAGPIATIIASNDIWATELPRIEVYGSLGTLSVPDPNTFGGPVRIRRAGASEWSEIPLTHGYADNSRGLGVADMAYALRSDRPHRANGDLAYHVLDVMESVEQASNAGQHVEIRSSCERPAPLPMGLSDGSLDA